MSSVQTLQSELATVQSSIKSELDRALDALFAAKEEVRKAREARAAGLAQHPHLQRRDGGEGRRAQQEGGQYRADLVVEGPAGGQHDHGQDGDAAGQRRVQGLVGPASAHQVAGHQRRRSLLVPALLDLAHALGQVHRALVAEVRARPAGIGVQRNQSL